jgi:predicted DNA-binding antitoxin AbrB/MazE fold protein
MVMNTITAECTIEHGVIKLPPSLGLPDGVKVLINIELLLNHVQGKKVARELAGIWKDDASITTVFSEIDTNRHGVLGRDIDPYDLS